MKVVLVHGGASSNRQWKALSGHSFGATVAMEAAAVPGERVSHLVLLEPGPYAMLRHAGDPAFQPVAAACFMRAFAVALRAIAESLHAARPDWTYVSIPAGGHMAPLTRPDLVNPMVASFLKS